MTFPRTRLEVEQMKLARESKHVVDAYERDCIDGLLIMHGFTAEQRAWMAPSCPGYQWALQLYPLTDEVCAGACARVDAARDEQKAAA